MRHWPGAWAEPNWRLPGSPVGQAAAVVEWRIEELLYEGAEYVVVADTDAHTETKYRAVRIADCVFVARDWRYAFVREAA